MNQKRGFVIMFLKNIVFTIYCLYNIVSLSADVDNTTYIFTTASKQDMDTSF